MSPPVSALKRHYKMTCSRVLIFPHCLQFMFSVWLQLYMLFRDGSRSYTVLDRNWTRCGSIRQISPYFSFLSVAVDLVHMRLGFSFLLLLSISALLKFDVFLPGPSHVSQCCSSSSNFHCGWFLVLASSLLLCQLCMHVSACFLSDGLQYWPTTSFRFLFLFLLFVYSRLSSLLMTGPALAFATLNFSTKDDIGSWSLDQTLLQS